MFRDQINRHFSRLRHLVKLEEAEERASFEEEFLRLIPEEREKAGRALLRLAIADSHFNAAGHRLLTFHYAERKPLPLFSLDVGDPVSLTKDNRFDAEAPFGTVYDRTQDTITVAFMRELGAWADEEGLYYLHRAGNRGTFRKTLEALKQAGEAEHGRLATLRNVLLGLKKPAEGDPVPLEKISFLDAALNPSQKRAVQMALESPDLCLIQGPPGTGKTTVLVEVIRQAVTQGKFVFATAPSNAACDHLLHCLIRAGVPALRLGHPARIMKHLRDHTLDFKVAHHAYAKALEERAKELKRLENRRERHRHRRALSWQESKELKDSIRGLEREIREASADIFAQVLREAPVMVGTHSSARDRILEGKKFDWLVMDEAAQGTEPSSWIPILKAEKLVLAGDHFQLPPTVRSPEAERKGLGLSLFERVHQIVPDSFKTLLEIQYRMHEKIMSFSSQEFYGGRVVPDSSVRHHCLADLAHVRRAPATEEVLVFLDTAGRGFEESYEAGSQSRYNLEEAQRVVQELAKLLECGVRPEEIAIISPYSAQTRLLTSMAKDTALEIDSVDSFQGREKEAVILSLVRSNVEGEMGFLTDTRRMNVAMTRARRKLVVIGDSSTLSHIPFYRDFIAYAESAHAYRTTWE